MNRVFPTTLFPEKAPVWFRELRIIKLEETRRVIYILEVIETQFFLRLPKEHVDQVCLIYFLLISLMLKKEMLTSTKISKIEYWQFLEPASSTS